MSYNVIVPSRDIFGETESPLREIARITKEISTYESLLRKFSFKVAELKSHKAMLEMENLHELEIVREFI